MLSISKAFNFRNLRISNLLGLRKCQILNSGLIEANQTILRLPGRAPSVSLVAGYQSEASRRHYDGPRKKKARKSKEIVDIDLLHLDIDNPHLWYRDARALKRRVICHLGPTNSGKILSYHDVISSKLFLYMSLRFNIDLPLAQLCQLNVSYCTRQDFPRLGAFIEGK